MPRYVWHHELEGEQTRLRLMSDLLDPTGRQALATVVRPGWRCLEIGAGNGSLSAWLADQVGPTGQVVATDLQTDYLAGRARPNLEVRQLDVTVDHLDPAEFDLVLCRALLHHLPARRQVLERMVGWTRPGGWVFVHEPDFTPSLRVEPPDQRRFWEQFLAWADRQQIDYFVGLRVAPWLQEMGLVQLDSEGRAAVYPGGSEWAEWWVRALDEVSARLVDEGGVEPATLDHLHRLYADPTYWTSTISFTATLGRRAG